VNAAVVGCGLIGRKRAAALASRCTLALCVDTDLDRARSLAAVHGARADADWRAVLDRDDIALVVVATRHDSLAEIAGAAAARGLHVLVEKPAARTAAELLPVQHAAACSGALVRVGYNHRYHPALRQARALVDSGALGPLLFVRARYGHGGRPGYDREWRARPELSGGGELIDQGVHLIDLARWFLGDFTRVHGRVLTAYWDMPVEDNAFLTLETPTRQVAFLHASCTEWKNLFSFEIYGRAGKLEISGLGGSYGLERLAFYRMLPEMGPPETTIWEYPRGDASFALETEEFLEDIRLRRPPSPGLPDALAVLRVVDAVYSQAVP